MTGAGAGSSTRLDRVQTLAAVLLCVLACFRATVTFEPFPYFSADPFQSPGQVTSLTPSGVVWLDAAGLVVASVVLLLHRAGGGRMRMALLGLGAMGGLGTLWWVGAWREHLNVDQARLAFSTLAALWSAVALGHVCADARRRTICLAVLLGVAMMLLAKGVVQVLVEHPDTLAWYRRDPEAFLRAQGWEPGSAQARTYERRLGQAEATGWFGLSNVYATVMAAGAVGLGAMAAGAIAGVAGQRRRADDLGASRGLAGVTVLALVGALSLVGLVLSRSKGGMAAGIGGGIVIGLLVLARAWLAGRGAGPSGRGVRGWIAWAAALTLVGVPIGGVALRGLIGERIGELSILFRWFYMQGAARIIAEHPVAGVGPAGFRDAYMLVKPPLAAEDVTSPHSLALDAVAGYGAPAGLAMVGVVLVLASSSVRRVQEDRGEQPGTSTGDATVRTAGDTKALALPLILATTAAALIERPLLTPEIAASRLGGLGLWILSAWVVLWAAGRWPRAIGVGACASAAVLVLHAGIEMTPIWPNAQAWFLAMLGVAGAAASRADATERGEPAMSGSGAPVGARRSRRWIAPAAAVAWTGLVLVSAPWRILGWEATLKRAWHVAEPVGRLRSDMDLLRVDPVLARDLGLSPESVRAALAALVGQAPAPSPEAFERQMSDAVLQAAARTEANLRPALELDHLDTLRASGRVVQHQVSALVALGDPAGALGVLEAGIVRASEVVGRLDSALAWSHLASLEALRGDILEQAGRAEDARAARLVAIGHHARAADLDPRGLFHPIRLARLAAQVGDADLARRWALRAIENSEGMRLDPLLGLSDRERGEMARLSSGSGPS